MTKDKRDALCGYILALVKQVFVGWSIRTTIQDSRNDYRETYNAWVKYTGNTNKLTYSEWSKLERRELLNGYEVGDQWQKK